MATFGDKLFGKVISSKAKLFQQGEFSQLASQAFERYVTYLERLKSPKIALTYPVGYLPNNTPILSTHKYSKESLFSKYQNLNSSQLPLNGIYQLVTLIESLLTDILRDVLLEFPNKISSKKKFEYDLILEAKTLEEIKLVIIDALLNEMAYKSPKDFAEEFNNYVGINFNEKPIFLEYIELKATRDIHIHNQGIANAIYLTKASSKARVKAGEILPVDNQYFLKSYECCIQITEILEIELDSIWPSEDRKIRQQQRLEAKKAKTKKK